MRLLERPSQGKRGSTVNRVRMRPPSKGRTCEGRPGAQGPVEVVQVMDRSEGIKVHRSVVRGDTEEPSSVSDHDEKVA
jgi:hypothetical protein